MDRQEGCGALGIRPWNGNSDLARAPGRRALRPREPHLIRRLALLVACCTAVALLVGESAPTQSTTPFLFGFAEDLPKEIGTQPTDPARALGATAMRLTTQWSPAQTQLDAAEITRPDHAVHGLAPLGAGTA